jgi:hypothetical protein
MAKRVGGNAHQRAILSRQVRTVVDEAMRRPGIKSALSTISNSVPLSPSGRVFRFAEHPLTLAAIGIVCGLAAVYIYGPILMFCFWILVLSLHRSKALEGLAGWIPVTCYAIVISVSGSVFYEIGRAIENHKEHPLTIEQVGQTFRNLIPKAQGSITNIYPTREIIRQKTEALPPQINIDTPYFFEIEDGARVYNAHITNIGSGTARHVIDAAKAVVAEKSIVSEETLFKRISLLAETGNLRQKDIAPWYQNSLVKAIPLEASADEISDFNRGLKVIYVGLLSTYFDDSGHVYHTHRCVIYTNKQNEFPGLCQGHNSSY